MTPVFLLVRERERDPGVSTVGSAPSAYIPQYPGAATQCPWYRLASAGGLEDERPRVLQGDK